MNRLELFQIDSILRSPGKTLEADNARQRSDPDHLTFPLHSVCSIGNRVEVEGRRATANDVDDAAATVYPQLLGTGNVVNRELLSMTPTRSGPEGSSWDIAGLHGSSEQRDCLLRELLA
jgi:hypothetical protein